MSKEAYFSIGDFRPSQRAAITAKLEPYGYVVSIDHGQLASDVQLGVIHNAEDPHERAIVLAQARGVPTLTLHRYLPEAIEPVPGQYHATRTDSFGINPFLCYAIAYSIVGNPQLAHAISSLAMRWHSSAKGAEMLALICHTGSIETMAELVDRAPNTIKSHMRRLIKNAVSSGGNPESGQDLLRLVYWEAYGKPLLLIAPRDRRDTLPGDDDAADDSEEE